MPSSEISHDIATSHRREMDDGKEFVKKKRWALTKRQPDGVGRHFLDNSETRLGDSLRCRMSSVALIRR